MASPGGVDASRPRACAPAGGRPDAQEVRDRGVVKDPE
jgi:hypothetical protein